MTPAKVKLVLGKSTVTQLSFFFFFDIIPGLSLLLNLNLVCEKSNLGVRQIYGRTT
eukprot:SAG11_NODE_1149_length_5682_cov_5.991401_2_plen_56_part_00